MVRTHGLEFAEMGGSFQALMESQAGREWLESGGNPLRYRAAAKRILTPLIEQFDGWKWESLRQVSTWGVPELKYWRDCPVVLPQSWLLSTGWRQRGLIDLGEIPGARR